MRLQQSNLPTANGTQRISSKANPVIHHKTAPTSLKVQL